MNPHSELCRWIVDGHPWEAKLEEPLRRCGFVEPRQAWKHLGALASQANFPGLYPGFFPSFLENVSQSYDADMALVNFARFSEKIFDKGYLYTLLTSTPSLLEALTVLFSGSQVLTDVMLSDPSHFDWLKQPETLDKSKSKDALTRDYYEMAGEDYLTDRTPSLLRRFKKRECIRIGLRDLMGKAECRETVADLANLADVCLQAAYEYANMECRKKYGVPYYQNADGHWKESEFAVIGMGKLGGRELNYSSDIDLIYIYTSSQGETRPEETSGASVRCVTNHEYFTKLAQRITHLIQDITGEGSVFRVDLDLRPEGRSGEIVNSLASCEVYYQSWGRTWERQALIKARVSAGSESLGEAFLNLLEPFIYRRNLDFRAIEEIKGMKLKINQSLKGKKTGKGHIKLGFGGIREIEFVIQAYQLLFGGRDKRLRVPNTLAAMDKLRELGFLSQEDHRRLGEAYVFLRNLENRVQVSYGLQTHILPEDPAGLARLARKMRVRGKTQEELASRLMEIYENHTEFVGAMFAGLFVEEKKQAAEEIAQKELDRGAIDETRFTEDLFKELPFTDAGRAYRFLASLRDGPAFSHPTEKSIQNFYAILPGLLEHCRQVPKPNAAVENLVKFVESSGARETYLHLFHDNEKFLELLLILFGGSDFLSETLIKQPDLVDILMDMQSIYRFKSSERMAGELARSLKSCDDLESQKRVLRRFKQGEELRVGIRYLIREADLTGTVSDLTHLADVYLQTVYKLACEELRRKAESSETLPEDFAIFGLGKLGGKELNFGSDLDIIFVYDEPEPGKVVMPAENFIAHYVALSQLIYQLTSEITPAGYAYKIDTDLRPEGSQGLLVLSLRGYENYFEQRAKIWEQQAMTRVRFVAGSPELGKRFLQRAHAFTYQPKLEYGDLIEIARLRDRMEKERAQETKKGKNVKLGFGGLADIEFAIQVLQLLHGYRHPKLRHANTLEVMKRMAESGIIDHEAADQLKRDYLFLRNLECALRILSRPFTNHLPKQEGPLAALAKFLGYRGENSSELARALQADYETTTGRIRTFYRKNLDHLLRTSL